MMKGTFKNVLSFEFWQNSVRALMVVITWLCRLLVWWFQSVSHTAMINPNFAPLVITGGVLDKSVGELSLTFISCLPSRHWEEAGLRNVLVVRFAGLAFVLINRITGTIFGVSGDMAWKLQSYGLQLSLVDQPCCWHSLKCWRAPATPIRGWFPVGIYFWFIITEAANKYHTRKLPDAISFFNEAAQWKTAKDTDNFLSRYGDP